MNTEKSNFQTTKFDNELKTIFYSDNQKTLEQEVDF